MQAARNVSAPLHFSVDPKVMQQRGYTAVVSVLIGNQPLNLRFEVEGP